MSFVFLFLSATTCQLDADCRGGFVCERSACVPAQAVGAPRVIFNVAGSPKANPNGEPPPPGMHLESRSRSSLIIAGSATLAAMWGLTWTESWAGCHNCDASVVAASFVPVLGPFIEAALLKQSDGSASLAPFLVFEGMVQLGGLAMIVIGTVLHHDVLVYDVGPVRASLMPSGAKDGAGLALVGRF